MSEDEKLYTLATGDKVYAGDLCYSVYYWIFEYLRLLRPKKANALEFVLDVTYAALAQYDLDNPFKNRTPEAEE